MPAQGKQQVEVGWVTIARSIALIAVGVVMLVWETVVEDAPNHYIIGAGLILLGLAPGIPFVQKMTEGK